MINETQHIPYPRHYNLQVLRSRVGYDGACTVAAEGQATDAPRYVLPPIKN